jgi:hypothetical protein
MRRDIGLSGPIYALFIVEKPKKKVDSSIKALNKAKYLVINAI